MAGAPTQFRIKEHDILQSDSTRYLILGFNGEGSFGKVAKCLNLTTKKVVAIKILNDYDGNTMERETEMLDALRCLDPDETNIVRFLESFRFLNLYCVVTEMLDMSVWDLINSKIKKCNPLTLNEIRPMVHQLMVALDVLRSQGIMHTDLKPDNIMLVDHKRQPYRIKLIDFGLALPESRVEQGMGMQAGSYRAPEVYLGLPLSTAVDMWGVGCVMADMYYGQNMFPDDCAYSWMKTFKYLLGPVDDWLLETGIYTYMYFIWENDATNPGWRLRTPEEYYKATGATAVGTSQFLHWLENLQESLLSCDTTDPVELKDKAEFLGLLCYCLEVKANERITPGEALSHPFLTMAHLAADIQTSVYAEAAFDLMFSSLQFHLHESNNVFNDRGSKETGVDNCDIPDPPAVVSLNKNNESGSDTNSDNRTTVSSSGYKEDCEYSTKGECGDAGFSDGELFELTPSTRHPSLSRVSEGDDIEPVSPESSQTQPCTNISSNPGSGEPSATADFPRVNTSADVEPNVGATGSSSSVDGDADNIQTAPDGAQEKPFFKGLHKILGRVRNRVLTIFRKKLK